VLRLHNDDLSMIELFSQRRKDLSHKNGYLRSAALQISALAVNVDETEVTGYKIYETTNDLMNVAARKTF
jgi:vesicle coat complex subunit